MCAQITKPYGTGNGLVNGSPADATMVNADFDTIYNDYNGNITNDNISASAAIVDTKLAQITTASKVSGAALTSLASVLSGAGTFPAVTLGSGTANTATYLRGDMSWASPISTWVDYSATSTIVGFSSFTLKQIYYKKVGTLVFVDFRLGGVSNSTTTLFTVPVTPIATPTSYDFLTRAVVNNSVASATPGSGMLDSSVGTVTYLYIDAASGAWTNTNNKQVVGQFWYEGV